MSRVIEEVLAAVDVKPMSRKDIVDALTYLNMNGYAYTLQGLLQETPDDILLMVQSVQRVVAEQQRQSEAEAAKIRAQASRSH